MLCRKPYSTRDGLYPCGQCIPCRVRKRREWTHRLMLEGALYEDNAFVTLTYSDEFLPVDGSLEPVAVSLWLKRLREMYRQASGRKLRFYLVGEYGDETWRPHYHVALFNFPSCARGRTLRDVRNRVAWRKCCDWCRMVGESWGKGDIDIGALETKSAQYLAGYVVKKMTSAADPRLMGRHREFARMSLRPGIGNDMMYEVASTLLQYNLEDRPDVPIVLDHGKKSLPLGRHLRGKLREFIGRDKKAPPEVLEKWIAEMSELSASARLDADAVGSLKRMNEKLEKGRLASFESRHRLYRQRKDKL